MTRAKTKPPLRKPVFDEEGILRFAALGVNEGGGGGVVGKASVPHKGDRHPAKTSDHDRQSLTLMLMSDVIARLRTEADRKGKTIEQIVEKLVSKHLGKH